MRFPAFLILLAVGILTVNSAYAAEPAKAPTYADVHAIFAKNCLSCHDSKEADGELVLETHESLMGARARPPLLRPRPRSRQPD